MPRRVIETVINAWLLGTAYLEALTTAQIIAPDLVAAPSLQILRSGTLFNTDASLNEDEQLTEAEIRVARTDRSGPQSVRLESVTGTASRASDTRWLPPAD